jgi:hypothetical protein
MFQWLPWRMMTTAEGTQQRSELGLTEAAVLKIGVPEEAAWLLEP